MVERRIVVEGMRRSGASSRSSSKEVVVIMHDHDSMTMMCDCLCVRLCDDWLCEWW